MNYEEAGIATMLAGLVRAREILDKEIETMQGKLQLAQNGGSALEAVREAKRRGANSYWAGKSDEERSVIMKQRWANKKARETGGDSSHYANMSIGQKGYWARMTPAERKAEMRRRAQVRLKNWAAEADVEKLHPRDPRSAKHEAWVKKMSKAMKASHKKRRGDAVPAVKMQHVNGEAVA